MMQYITPTIKQFFFSQQNVFQENYHAIYSNKIFFIHIFIYLYFYFIIIIVLF